MESQGLKQQGFGQGFGLIEVLIALLVISIGALGYAKMQMVALQTTTDTAFRIQASVLLDDMAGRIQTNSANALLGTTSAYLGSSTQNALCFNTSGHFCDPSQMAANDLWEWKQMVQNTLPEGLGVVCLETTPGSAGTYPPTCTNAAINPSPLIYTIKVFWKNRAGNYQSIVALVQPNVQK